MVNNNIFIDSFQEKIWKDKYQYKNETFDEFCNRIASNVFSSEEEHQYKDELFNYLRNFEVLFGGRINANIGVEEEGLTLFNCYICSTKNKDMDSLSGILDLLKEYAVTLKSEGGIGFCANFFRPANTIIRKVGVTSPGVVKFLEIFDKTSEVITSGSVDTTTSMQGTPTKNSIRKGATMVTLNICHPDIEEFITAKKVPNRLTKMNLSVLITDAFMYAVENDLDWDLWFPDINFEKYEDEWDGSFEKWAEKGYPVVTYRKVRAVYLWDLLLKSSYNRNEPGVIFIDSMRRYNNLSYLDGCEVNGTNPCCIGETRLHTMKGMLKLKDLYELNLENEVIVDNRTVDNTLGACVLPASPVNKTKEYADVYRVVTKAGYEVVATNYHEFYTKRGKLQLKDLVVGDNLFVVSGKGAFGSNGDIGIGHIIGSITGDGTLWSGYYNSKDNYIMNAAYIRLWGKDKELSSYFENTINNVIKNYKVKGQTYTIKARNIEDRDMIEIKSAVLYKVLLDLGATNLKNTVPEYIFSGSRECVKGYLQGLFQADGCAIVNYKSNTSSVRLSSISLSLLKDVQLLLSNFGIFSRIYHRKGAGLRSLPDGKGGQKKYFCKDNYELIIDGSSRDLFMSEIGFMLDYKNKNYVKWVKNKKLYKKEKYSSPIVLIEYYGKEDVYCLNQPKTHSCVFNGIVTGQCSEVFGSVGTVEYKGQTIKLGDVCNLGSVNVVKFYDIKTKKFDFTAFSKRASIMVRALDNIIDISNYPLEQYELSSKLRRKIGVGMTGIGSLFMMMNLRYGSEESVGFLEKLFKVFMNTLYKESAILAKEKGPFELYSEALVEKGYVSLGLLDQEVVDLIKQNGLRHSALSCVAPNGCLVDGVLVPTSEGCFAIEDNESFSSNIRSLKLPSDFESCFFDGWFDKGYSNTIKITTHHGYSIEGTPPHKLRVVCSGNGYIWKSLEDIKQGDVVVMKKDFLFDKNTFIREDVAELLGFYMADGWFTGNRLYFQVNNNEVEYIKSLIIKCFKHKFSRIIVRPRDDKNSSRIEVNSKKIKDWFIKYGCVKEGAENAFIPKSILKSSRATMISFIKGYFIGDGGFNESKQNIKFTTVSYLMAYQLQIVLLGLGIPTHRYVENTKGNKLIILDKTTISNFDVHRVELSVFNSRKLCELMGVGFSNICKKYDGRNFEPVLLSPEEFFKFNTKVQYEAKDIACVTDYIYRNNVAASDSNWFVKNNMFLDTIKTIEHSSCKKHVQDLSVDSKAHTYVANGFITHNTLSIIAGNVSGGIEPVFSKEFNRWNRVEGKKVEFVYPNVHKGEWFETEYLKETTAGGEPVLESIDGKFRVDKNTGLCEKITIQDYGYKVAQKNSFNETAGATELSIDEHLKVLSIASKYIDLSVSKTINIPNDISFDEFKALYGRLYHYGIKGCTTYREGTSVAVLEAEKKEQKKTVKQQQEEFLEVFKNQNGGVVASDIKLPDEYPARGYILKTEGKKFYLHVCFKDKACTKPFAIFVNTNAREDNILTFNALDKLEDLAYFKGVKKEFVEETKRKYAYQKNPVKICRMLGLLLRHNINIYDIVKALDEVEEATIGTFVNRIKKFLSQFIMEYEEAKMVCPECGEKSIIFSEGCFICKQCGYSRCG